METFKNTREPFTFKKTRELPSWFLNKYGRFYLRKKAVIIDDYIYCSNKKKKKWIKWHIDNFVNFQKKYNKEQGIDELLNYRPYSVSFDADYIEQGGECMKNQVTSSGTFYDDLIEWLRSIFSFS